MEEYIIEVLKLMKKWDSDKNKDLGLYPEQIVVGSGKRAWWRCNEMGHSYPRIIYREFKKDSKCPTCIREKKIFIVDVPELMGKWDNEKNSEMGLFPEEMTVGSGILAWWRCNEKGHSYPRRIGKQFKKANKCPICKRENKIFIKDVPRLMDKWDIVKNREIGLRPEETTVGSTILAWWRCREKGHSYPRIVSKETSRKSQCPICKKKEQKYLSDFPELVNEFAHDLNDCIPEEITKGSDKSVWWRCQLFHHTWKNSSYHRIKDNSGCPYCAGFKVWKGFNDLETVNPQNLKYWDHIKNSNVGLFPYDFMVGSNKFAWWTCDCGHTYNKRINQVMECKNPCHDCLEEKKKERAERIQLKINKKNMRKTEIERLRIETHKIPKRKRANKEIYYASIKNKVEKYWDSEENSKYGKDINRIHRHDIYFWKCSNGHSWMQSAGNMIDNPRCIDCYVAENSISIKHPYLVEFYDTIKNRHIPPEKMEAIAGNYYWWKCKKGHEYIATLKSVDNHRKTGCMFCDGEKSIFSL